MGRSAILAVDIGNSRIKFGLFDGDGAENKTWGLARPVQVLAVRHADPIPWETLAGWHATSRGEPAQAAIAGVKPAAMERLLAEWPRSSWPTPLVVKSASELPLVVRVVAPDGVGIDRLLGAVAANAIRSPNQPVIVIGAGTATTVDLIAADGAFEGGAILPGLELCALGLHQYTALLPMVPVGELADPQLPAVGKDTPAAIRSGLLYGHVGAVKEVVSRLSATLKSAGGSRSSNPDALPLVLINGGNGPLLAPHLGGGVREERDLPLRGLASITGLSKAPAGVKSGLI